MNETGQIGKAEKKKKMAEKGKRYVKETRKFALMERERRRERMGDHVSYRRVDEINWKPVYLLAVRRRDASFRRTSADSAL